MFDTAKVLLTTMAEVLGEIRREIEAMKLPEGYTFFWDSQYKDQREAMQAIGKFFPAGFSGTGRYSGCLVWLTFAIRSLFYVFFRCPLSEWLSVCS